MIENGMRYLRGYVKIQIQGYSPERFLNLCSYHHILIWGLAYEDHCYELCMSVRDFKRIRPFAKKTHTKVRVKEKYGFPFSLYNNRKRKLFFAGFIICIFLLQIYSMFIWDIHFTGNETRTDEALSSFLREKGVFAGMLKKEADCRKIVKEIRTQYDDVVWVSASLDGSRLKIQIKENEDSFEKEEKKKDENAVDLVASSDGVITKIVTRTGTPQVHVGDTVKKGDILVSGRVEIVNDSKEVIGYKYCHADADIFADTQMEYEDELSASYEEKVYDKKEKHRFYVKVKDTRVSFGSVKMKPNRCEFISKEYGVKAGKNFYLPFSYGIYAACRDFAPAGATKGHENKRSLRSPFGNLRRRHSLSFVFLGLCRKYIPERPIRTVGSWAKHADTVCRRYQPNRAEGSREELPCRVQGQRPCLWRLSQLRAVFNRCNHVDAALVTAALEFGGQPVGRNHLR